MNQVSSRNLTQEEIDAHWRADFIDQVLRYIETGKEAKFLAKKDKLNLVQIKQVLRDREWEFSIGDNHLYTYHKSKLLDFLEAIYDRGCEVTSLNGEIDVTLKRVNANF